MDLSVSTAPSYSDRSLDLIIITCLGLVHLTTTSLVTAGSPSTSSPRRISPHLVITLNASVSVVENNSVPHRRLSLFSAATRRFGK
jgi:hypothetical protein